MSMSTTGTSEMARDKAAKLLKKRGSVSSSASNDYMYRSQRKQGSVSTISFVDEPHDERNRPTVSLENTYRLQPGRRFPDTQVQHIIRDVLEGYLADEKYEPDLCRQMTKTLSEVIKARVKDLRIPRFKVIAIIHIGQLKEQALRVGSRCLWDASCDTYASHEFKNSSLFAIGTVYGIYAE